MSQIDAWNSPVILIVLSLPAVRKVIDVFPQSAIRFGEVIFWCSIVIATEAARLIVVRAVGPQDEPNLV